MLPKCYYYQELCCLDFCLNKISHGNGQTNGISYAPFTLQAVSPMVTCDPRQRNRLPGRPVSSKLFTLQADGHGLDVGHYEVTSINLNSPSGK